MTENKHSCYYCGAEIKSPDTVKCLKCDKNLLTFDEAKMLKEAATQTRFTWVVLLLTFITALIGLLALIPVEISCWAIPFIIFLVLAYGGLTFGLGYSVYSLCRTTFIIDLLGNYKQSIAVNDFLFKYWHVEYVKFIIKEETTKEGKIKVFKDRHVTALACVIGSISIILLITRLLF